MMNGIFTELVNGFGKDDPVSMIPDISSYIPEILKEYLPSVPVVEAYSVVPAIIETLASGTIFPSESITVPVT